MMRDILFIVNPIAGGKDKKAIVESILGKLDTKRYRPEVRYTEYAGHACELARETSAEVVVAIGGDGTQNEVARSLLGTDKTLGIVPCGSGDGLALHLGISRNPEKAAKVFNDGASALIDYGIVCDHPFFCTTGVGLDAIVSYRFAKAGTRGLSTYIKESGKAWFNFEAENYRVTVDGEEKWNGPATLITVGNANQWGNKAEITPLASLNDGLLDVIVVDEFHTIEFPELLRRLMDGSAQKSHHATYFKGRKITIERDSEGPLHFDGDPYMMGRKIDISLVPKALRVIIPKERLGSI